jgi:malate dehydrogenase (quinone)
LTPPPAIDLTAPAVQNFDTASSMSTKAEVEMAL